MGIDVSGGMLVGAHFSDLVNDIPEDFEHGEYEVSLIEYLTEYLEESYSDCMVSYSPWYGACSSECWIGYEVSDVPVDLLDEKWLKKIKKLGDKFESITGAKAFLIGVQNIY